jgi:hypothetical protein
MSDLTFKPAGAAFAAIVAGLGAVEAEAPKPVAEPMGAGVNYASLPAAEPLGGADVFAALDAENKDVPLAPPAQLNLPF